MRFGVLGTLQIRGAAGEDIPLPGPQRRRLLAALLCQAGRPVDADSLIGDLWGEVPPRSAAKTLQSHVVRLRDDLGRDGGSVVRTEPNGYRLAVGADDVDALAFADLVARAARADRCDARTALGLLDRALAMWRGEAYLDLGDAGFAVTERIRLAELRGLAFERRTDLALAAGRAAELVSELEARVAAEPYRERGWEQLMLALYRCGRQADALGAYRRVRDVLGAELGVDPGPGLRVMEERVLRHDPTLLAAAPQQVEPAIAAAAGSGRCPYRGLAGYAESDASLFVGRERLVADLAGRIAAARLVTLTGPSGSGKSSLVHAGLLPALRAGALPDSATWRTSVVTPPEVAEGGAAARPDLLVVDQVEELFTVCDDDVRSVVVDRLVRLVSEGTRLVLAVRGDHFGRLAELGPLAELAGNTVLVRPMRDDEIRRVVVEPAIACGYAVEPALIDAALDEISGQQAALPLLSAALVRTWDNREDGLLTLAGYRRGGGIGGALEAGAEDVWNALPDGLRPDARRLLLRLSAPSGNGWVRRPLPVDEALPDDAADRLLAARLLTVVGTRLEIVHDELLRSWPRLHGWLTERALAADQLDHLAAAARVWDESGRADGDLYRGARLQAALEWSQEHPDDIGPVEGEFLAAAERAGRTEVDAIRERADREARGRRRLRLLAAALAVVLVASVVTGLVALRERRSAQRAADAAAGAALTADARRLAAEALSAPDLRSSLLLAVAAQRLEPSVDTRSALLTTLERGGNALWRISTPQRVQWVGSDAAGSQVWEADNQQGVTRYDTSTHHALSHFDDHATQVQDLSPDGRTLLVSGSTGAPTTLSALDARTGAPLGTLSDGAPESPTAVRSAQFTTDGRWVVSLVPTDGATATTRPEVAIYAANDLSAAPRHVRLDAPAVGVATGRDRFVVATAAGTLDVVDATTLHVDHSAHRDGIAQSFAPDGGEILALAPDGDRVAAIDLKGRPVLVRSDALSAPSARLDVEPGLWQAVRFSPDGRDLALGDDRGDVAVLDAATGRAAAHLPGEDGAVMAVRWAGPPGAEQLFSGGLDSELVSWNLVTSPRMVHVSGPSHPVGAFGVHGHELTGFDSVDAVFGGPGIASMRYATTDLRTGARTSFPLGLDAADVLEGSSPDTSSDRVLVAIKDGQGRHRCDLWDVPHGRMLHRFSLPLSADLIGGCVLSGDASFAAATVGRDRIAEYTLPDIHPVRTVTLRPSGPVGAAADLVPLAVAPDGRLVVQGTVLGDSAGLPSDRMLALVARDGTISAQRLLGAGDDVLSTDWSADGSRLVVGTSGGTVTVLDASTLATLAPPAPAAGGYVLAATFSPDGSTVLTSGTDSTVRLFDARTLRPIGSPLVLPGDNWAYAGWTGTGAGIAGLGAFAGDGTQRSFTFPGDAATWMRTACSIAGSDFSRAEWDRYVGDRPYTAVCAGG